MNFRHTLRPAVHLLTVLGCLANTAPAGEALKPDPDTLLGTLDSGLTYFIRENHKPTNRLDLRLVVRVGSVMEADDQQGLAHLLEHMAFNGTENFDRQQLVNYLESLGMRFGPDLNAYTSLDQTVYLLQVPVDTPGAVDSGFRVLRDWAFGIRNETEQINQERKVVIEEWRLGRGADQRLRDKQFPVLLQGSQYADRLPIGKKEILDTFAPQRVRDFYADWYRPELMAVLAIGPLDPKEMLDTITTLFKGEPGRPDAPPRVRHAVPEHADTLVSIETDPEATSYSLQLTHKHGPDSYRTTDDYRTALIDELVVYMLRQRLDERQREAGTPLVRSRAYDGEWILGASLFTIAADVQPWGVRKGLELLLREEQRIRRFGFTASELTRAKAALELRAERRHAARTTTESSRFAGLYTKAFIFDRVAPSTGENLALVRQMLPGIRADDVAERLAVLVGKKNRVVLVSGPEPPETPMPDEDEVRGLLDAARTWEVTPYLDTAGNMPLLATEPVRGAITSRRSVPSLGLTEWTLSNGARVILKPTAFKKDEILFRAIASGGHSRAGDDTFVAATSAAAVARECGFGAFSRIDLQKTLAGKAVSVVPVIDELRSGIGGACRPKDLVTFMRLVHLACTEPRRDRAAFEVYREKRRAELELRLARPEAVFGDRVMFTLAGNHPRRKPWTPETLDRMDLASSLEFYRNAFADASGFTFVFVGDLDLQVMDDLCCRYLASLPSSRTGATWRDLGIRPPSGTVNELVVQGAAPKGRVYRVYGAPFEWGLAERVTLKALAHILRIRLRETLRESIGGTYHAGVRPVFRHYPDRRFEMRISFGCDPDKIEPLIAATEAEVERMQTQLVDDSYLKKATETLLQEWHVGLEKNGTWLQLMDDWVWHGDDPAERIANFETWVGEVSAAAIRKAAVHYLKTPDVITILLKPDPARAQEE